MEALLVPMLLLWHLVSCLAVIAAARAAGQSSGSWFLAALVVGAPVALLTLVVVAVSARRE